MFTGIVLETGRIIKIQKTKGLARFKIASKIASKVKIGSSVSCNGVCLTVVKNNKNYFEVEAVPETLKRTNLGDLKKDEIVNLEPSLRLGAEFSGHFVLGHIDGVGRVVNLLKEGNSVLCEIEASKEILKYVAFKGAVACDGVSLTVAKLNNDCFTVALIPHTLKVTNLSKKKVGDKINLEVDIMARYLERLIKN
ncbi:MAG: riboflavin synthase [Patescibacteria group bacterium]